VGQDLYRLVIHATSLHNQCGTKPSNTNNNNNNNSDAEFTSRKLLYFEEFHALAGCENLCIFLMRQKKCFRFTFDQNATLYSTRFCDTSVNLLVRSS
jgi:hypothetical protein